VSGECPAYIDERDGAQLLSTKAVYWRARAEEVRIIAEDFTHSETRERMLKIAEGYECMASEIKDSPSQL
jgi:hypothetical protein